MNQTSIYLIIQIFFDHLKKETRITTILIFILGMMNMTQKIIQSQSLIRGIKSISLKTQLLFALKGRRLSKLLGKARQSGCRLTPHPALSLPKSLVVEDRVIKFLNLGSALQYWCRSDLEKLAIFQAKTSNACSRISF